VPTLNEVPAGAQYEVRHGRGPTNQRFVLVDVTWQDKMVGPFPTRAKAEHTRMLMQAEADRKSGKTRPGETHAER